MDTEDDIFLIHKRVIAYISNVRRSQDVLFQCVKDKITAMVTQKPPHGFSVSKWQELAKMYNIADDVLASKKNCMTYKQCKDVLQQAESLNDNKEFLANAELYETASIVIINKYKQCINNIIHTDFMSVAKSKDTMSPEQKKHRNDLIDLIENVLGQHVLETTVSRKISSCQSRSDHSGDESHETDDTQAVEDHDDEWTGMVYNDTTRLNWSQRFKYDKRLHFKETITKYQGLQHTNIPPKVLQDVITMIELHGLADTTKSNPKERYSSVTKKHIKMFLNESGNDNTDYYEDVALIHSKITGIPCPNIQHLEKGLYQDFEQLVEVFLSFPAEVVDRKNFLNAHYILRQLMLKRGIVVPDDDLNNLRTPNRQRTHDEIYQMCCEKLGWNFTPLAC